jgi:hypothetical protein
MSVVVIADEPLTILQLVYGEPIFRVIALVLDKVLQALIWQLSTVCNALDNERSLVTGAGERGSRHDNGDGIDKLFLAADARLSFLLSYTGGFCFFVLLV